MTTQKKNEYFAVFWAFFKIGALTFGGGYAMIPIIEKEAVEKKGWVSSEDVLDVVAIAESTPGVLAVNAATFIGYRAAGVAGSALATLGVTLPSLIVISMISMAYQAFLDNPWVMSAFMGIRCCVGALILNTVIKFYGQLERSVFSALVALAAFCSTLLLDIETVTVILVSGVAGIIAGLVSPAKKTGEGSK